MVIKVKICGITNYRDAADAIDYGADALGFVFASSPRQLSPPQARTIIRKLPPFVLIVGVFVNRPINEVREILRYCPLHLAQLHGDERKIYVHSLHPQSLKAFKAKDSTVLTQIKSFKVPHFLLDTSHPVNKGRVGIPIPIPLAKKASKLGRMILAGGLTHENVSYILQQVKPYGVDVSSGVESYPGKKDKDKVQKFIRRVKENTY